MKCPKCNHEFEKENRGEKQKLGMIEKASKGNPVSRPAFGYKFSKGRLVPRESFREVEEIFEEFLQKDMNLTKLTKKHNFSVNGLKKVLKNFTYIGKIKFNGQIHEGKHKPLISTILFNKVQDKLDRLKR
jgi:site-specific DNA recombinase